MAKTIHINASKEYDILIGSGLLKDAAQTIGRYISPRKTALITEDTVYPLYGKAMETELTKAGYPVVTFTYPHGEGSKNIKTLSEILEFLADNQITRTDFLIALGGGVTGDMAGFAAAVYLRGIAYVQIPTTFLAAIDSSVGGKTGVNLTAGKNLAGAFHQPGLVLCDYETLSTLGKEDFACGMAEAIKYGVLNDTELFFVLQNKDIIENLEWIITRCVEAKKKLVMEDEFDTGARQLLNLGHTPAHAIEKLSNFKTMHGQAVAIGMSVISKAAYKAGLSSENCYEPIVQILKRHSLPTLCPYTAEELCDVILADKKRTGDYITLVIPDKIGTAFLHKMAVSDLEGFFRLGL